MKYNTRELALLMQYALDHGEEILEEISAESDLEDVRGARIMAGVLEDIERQKTETNTAYDEYSKHEQRIQTAYERAIKDKSGS